MTALALSPFLAVDDNAVSPGVLGFLVVALLGVATWLLIRSMNRQIRRIDLPDEHEAPPGSAAEDTEDSSDRPEPDGPGVTPR